MKSDQKNSNPKSNAVHLLNHDAFVRRFKCREAQVPDSFLVGEFITYHNEWAFAELYKRYKPRMLAYLYGLLRSWEDAKDVFHDACEVMIRSCNNGRYKEKGDFEGWFKSTCYRKASEWKRRKRGIVVGDQVPDHADPSFNAEQRMENRQRETLLYRAVHILPESERQVVILRLHQKMNFYEIAVMRNMTAGGARAIYCKALKKLKKAIG